jgi:Domain of unknown function (DUF1707)
MRVSDIERQRAIDELRRHCGAGRIDVDEYASRIERALSATTLEELDQLLGDLPILRIADPEGSTSSNGRGARARRSSGLRAEALGWGGATAADDAAPRTAAGSQFALRIGGSLVIVISVVVVLAAVTVAVLAGWTWAVVLLIGWVIGLVQARAGRARDRYRRL